MEPITFWNRPTTVLSNVRHYDSISFDIFNVCISFIYILSENSERTNLKHTHTHTKEMKQQRLIRKHTYRFLSFSSRLQLSRICQSISKAKNSTFPCFAQKKLYWFWFVRSICLFATKYNNMLISHHFSK